MDKLSPQYSPQAIEPNIYQFWLDGKYFHAEPDAPGQPYCIVIPPPNVTAALHMGHALNNTLQDILIRYHRMLGNNTTWIPGTDHAGIATQTVVEKRVLAEEGKRRTDFKREEFVAKIQAWKDEYEARILSQLKRMGCSCDWDRTRFTMDEICARAVREAFFILFKDGLIYRGKRLVNWDPATQTALADDEVEMHEIDGHFWYLKYPLTEPVEMDNEKITHVTVATTRPETMLGDTAVAINPADPRAKYLVGKKVRLPIVDRIIPIIEDDYVVLPDPNSDDAKARFATGFLKVTPAHDPNDWEIGERHNLPIINVLAPDGTISDRFGWEDVGGADFLLGLDRYEAREAIVDWFRQNNLLEDVKPYKHSVGHSYRSHVPIEPYLSDQWYVKVTDERLAGSALRAMADDQYNGVDRKLQGQDWEGKLRFFPERYAKTFQTWHENIRDWCISRQLWWGHRIPVWSYPGSVPEVTEELLDKLLPVFEWQKQGRVALQYRGEFVPLEAIEKQGGLAIMFVCVRDPQGQDTDIVKYLEEQLELKQDPDVLDTWFSSALWPFSTLGWPENTPELQKWNPTNLLCTAREIITLWVSRMVMTNLYFLNRLPFTDVYIHAMIQDGQGRKMSKTLGNGIDPVDIIEQYGADAMRYSLAYLTTGMQDIRMPVKKLKLSDGREVNTSERFEIGRNLCNKLWNAARFVILNLNSEDTGNADNPESLNIDSLALEDKWILSRLNNTIKTITEALNKYEFAESASVIYRFFWNEFCDWYLEWIKPRLKENNETSLTAKRILAYTLDNVLRLLHPIAPFITEELWKHLRDVAPVRMISETQLDTDKPLIISSWPKVCEKFDNEQAEQLMHQLQQIIRAIRDVRTTVNKIRSAAKEKSFNQLPLAFIRCNDFWREIFSAVENTICELAKVSEIKYLSSNAPLPTGSSVKVFTDSLGNSIELAIPLSELIDIEQEKKRLQKELDEITQHIERSQARLSNKKFIDKAPAHIVEEHRQRLEELKAKQQALQQAIDELK